ncbi:MAG: glycoside hydrolase family 2, partial [Calditrichaeota bacterium]|nr:glycoside hydrolase family 2 [Calditrichota bacterium]
MKHFLICLSLLLFYFSSNLFSAINLQSVDSHHGAFKWLMKRKSDTSESGAVLSTTSYVPDNEWLPAIVPGTVLNSLVYNKVYPEPYYGLNNKKSENLIPDIADVGREFYHYWFRTTFMLPEDFKGRRVWMRFDGINYEATIWLNGKKIGETAGMFKRTYFDITTVADFEGKNVLSVDVLPVEHPGKTYTMINNNNGAINKTSHGGDGEIGKDVTMLMSAGWDFTFPDGIRDRNTGIWRDVIVFSTGAVTLRDPFVKTDLPLPKLTPSRQTVSVNVINATDKPQTGILRGAINDNSIIIRRKIFLKSGEVKEIIFRPEDYPQLIIRNPRLWWPRNKGEQYLYRLKFNFSMSNGIKSDQIETRFGIREITANRSTPDKSLIFYVNGKRLFIRGSNWIPEAMCRTSKLRTYAELKYTQQAGINMLRLWGGGISESDYFFDLCDELGILVWHEFWMTGDTKLPVNIKLYLANVKDTIKRIRSHPSVAYYVSSSERGPALDISTLVNQVDGTRNYQPQAECCGVHAGGPYKYENPMQYYDDTVSDRGSRIYGFSLKYGAPILPTIDCLREMMDPSDLWPINKKVWNYLDGGGSYFMTTKYDNAVNQYGLSSNIVEYAKKAQLVGAVTYRSIWENWNYNKFNYGDRFCSGVLFWYHNSPIRQVCGRMWDWSLEPTAALYYTQDALEPLHAQYNFLKNTVSVYNDYYQAFANCQLSIRIFNIDMSEKYYENIFINIPEDCVLNDVITVDLPDDLSKVHFIKLELKDNNG